MILKLIKYKIQPKRMASNDAYRIDNNENKNQIVCTNLDF